MISRWLTRQKLHAIHKRDLEAILEEFGMRDAILSGSLLCGICGTPITLDTLQCLFFEDGEIKVCCSKMSCYQRVLAKKEASRQ